MDFYNKYLKLNSILFINALQIIESFFNSYFKLKSFETIHNLTNVKSNKIQLMIEETINDTITEYLKLNSNNERQESIFDKLFENKIKKTFNQRNENQNIINQEIAFQIQNFLKNRK